MTVQPPDLERKLLRKIDMGKGTQLTPVELDILLECGAIGKLSQAASDFRERQCRARNARNRSINGENTGSTKEPDEAPSKSSGTMNPEGVKEALARARQMCGKEG